MHYNMKIIENWIELSKIKKQWKHLEISDSECTIYQSYNWTKNYCKFLISNKKAYIVTFFLENVLIGIFPLQIRKFRNIEIYEFMGSCGIDYLMPLVIDSYKEIVYTLFCKWLETQHPNKVFVFEDIPNTHSFSKHLHEYRYNYCIKEYSDFSPYYFACLPNDWDSYKNGLSKRMQHDLEYDRRYINRKLNIEFLKLDYKYIDEHINLNISRMHSKNLKSPFDEESACMFWKEFYYDEFMSGRLDFDAIVADSKIVSSILSINVGKIKFITNLNINIEYAKLSPGNVLLGHIFEESIYNKYEVLDFGRGSDSYKYRFGAIECFNSRFVICTNIKNHNLYCSYIFYLYKKIGYYLSTN